MLRTLSLGALAAMIAALLPTVTSAEEISGSYLETRTCQVYTGPCFANGEIGLCGRDAIMAWNIETGTHRGVDLAGLSVVVVVNASDTFAHYGMDDVDVKSVILVDEKANQSQQKALIAFAKKNSGKAGKSVQRVTTMPIAMSLNTLTLQAKLQAGKEVKVVTRKAHRGDCICSNESAYYPPLAKVENFAPGVTLEGYFKGRSLGSRWSTPDARSAYMATFFYE